VRGHLGARLVPHRGAAIVVALSATVTVSYGVLLYAFPVLFVPMRDELGLTASQLSLAATIGLGTSALAGIWIGWLLDHRDPRVVMTAGSVLATVSVVLWSRVRSASWAPPRESCCSAATCLSPPCWPRRSWSRRSQLHW
jgi:MFS family permease